MPLLLIAGLPATGKSRLGAALAQELGGHVIDKDLLRAALFEPSRVEYSAEQDDFVFSLMQQAAEWLWRREPALWIVLGGRTFARRSLRQEVYAWAAGQRQPVARIECVCSETLIQERLRAPHPARNRDWAMWQQLRDRFEPLDADEPHLRLDSGGPFEDCVAETLTYLLKRGLR
jgi:predicted kinase